MPFDFSSIKLPTTHFRPIDPIELFQSLKVTDTGINDLWLAQGDALREWHSYRTDHDISVELNTGAGKTLVGLLVAQSLVNETNSLVLYACGSIQLVKQTEQKALGYGLQTTTYIAGEFSNELAETGHAPCITTYQALLNGKSIFRRRDVAAVIFDDAHVAEHLLRESFSLHLRREIFPNEYGQILSMFEDYFSSVDRLATYLEIRDGRPGALLLVHPSEVKRSRGAILDVLHNSQVASQQETLFAWEHVKESLDLCGFLLSGSEITITPPFVPVPVLPYFENDKRRVYLSATLGASDVFVRTFGREPDRVIAPSTTIGECERMILIPRMGEAGADDVPVVLEAIEHYKALILVPTYARAKVWEDAAVPPDRDEVTREVDSFKAAKDNSKLILTARYDGVDLPGDMCRMLVIDDLPSAIGPLDRFLWEYLRLESAFRSAIACRITQSFGRISRGMSDHGVVCLSGKALIEWMRVPKNMQALPSFIQRQLKVGFQLSAKMSRSEIVAAPAACIGRDAGWIDAYTQNMQEQMTGNNSESLAKATALALAEAKYGCEIWRRNYAEAALALQSSLDAAFDFSLGTAAWYSLWIGYALELAGDEEAAQGLYKQASVHRSLPKLRPGVARDNASQASSQAQSIAGQFTIDTNGRVRVPSGLERNLAWLAEGSSSAQVESALSHLGNYLGIRASRPDNDFGTGPDVLWMGPDSRALCLDAKTDKEQSSVYNKKELGQLSDHLQWVRENEQPEEIICGFVGPQNGASETANPPAGVLVATLASFRSLADRLKALYHDASESAVGVNLEDFIQAELARRDLDWARILDVLELKDIRDL